MEQWLETHILTMLRSHTHLQPELVQDLTQRVLVLSAHHVTQLSKGLEPCGQGLQLLVACAKGVSSTVIWLSKDPGPRTRLAPVCAAELWSTVLHSDNAPENSSWLEDKYFRASL